MAVQRCVVRIRSDLKAEALASAIASTKVMKAQQVVKSESGEEVKALFSLLSAWLFLNYSLGLADD